MPTKTLLKNFFISMAPLYYSVWKSKFYGAFVLNRRVVLHATQVCAPDEPAALLHEACPPWNSHRPGERLTEKNREHILSEVAGSARI